MRADARPVIFGCTGPALNSDERILFAERPPAGLIVFARNIKEPSQLADLVAKFRDTTGQPDALVLIDQEGGRVARLGPPHWPEWLPARVYGRLYRADPELAEAGLSLHMRLIAAELRALGINVDCAPVLDLDLPGANGIIGDRAFGPDPELVGDLGRIAAESLLAGGCLPVIKHIPGHGRAAVDSHKSLPIVETSLNELEATDFLPFRRNREMPLAMTGHIVYKAVDDRPVTLSPKMIRDVIRGRIGFQGLILSDDLCMNALSGSMAERARGALAAGVDLVLQCDGNFEDMSVITNNISPLPGTVKSTLEEKINALPAPDPTGRDRLRAEYGEFSARAAEMVDA